MFPSGPSLNAILDEMAARPPILPLPQTVRRDDDLPCLLPVPYKFTDHPWMADAFDRAAQGYPDTQKILVVTHDEVSGDLKLLAELDDAAELEQIKAQLRDPKSTFPLARMFRREWRRFPEV